MYQQRDAALVETASINIDPDLKNHRGESRYKAYLHKIKLPD